MCQPEAGNQSTTQMEPVARCSPPPWTTTERALGARQKASHVTFC